MTTKKTVDELIDKLADKTLSLGCVYEQPNFCRELRGIVLGVNNDGHIDTYRGTSFHSFKPTNFKKINKLLGHPIMKCHVEKHLDNDEKFDDWDFYADLMNLWRECGLTKSLQTIISEDTEKSKNLVQFLISLFITK